MPVPKNTTADDGKVTRSDSMHVSSKFAIQTLEEEVEARCLTMIAGAQMPLDHSPASRALAKLPEKQVEEFDRKLKQGVRVLLSKNATILDKHNPNLPEKE